MDYEELKRAYEELKSKDEERSTEIEQLKNKEKERSLGSLRKKYLPLLDRTFSTPHFPKNHGSPVVTEKELKFDEWINDWIANEDFWNTPLWAAVQEEEHIDCDSEGEALWHVKHILAAVLRALKLQDIVQVVTNRTLAGVECDILLVYKPNRLPFSPIEVKKPGSTAEMSRRVFYGWPRPKNSKESNKQVKEEEIGEDSEEPDERLKEDDVDEDETEDGKDDTAAAADGRDFFNGVAGEMLHECSAVELFGYKQVFGLLTTGNHWRITSSKEIALEDQAMPVTTAISILRQKSSNDQKSACVSPKQGTIVFEETDEGNGNAGNEDNTLYASQIVPGLEDKVTGAGEKIVKLIVAYVLMACTSLAELLDSNRPLETLIIRPKMPCRILRKKNPNTFAFGTATLSKSSSEGLLETFISKNVETLRVIHHLGSGGNGNCCLAVSTTARSCCAIKFFHRMKGTSTKDMASEELKNWKAVYGNTDIMKECTTWGNEVSACLVMPYLKPIPVEKRWKLLQEGKIKKVLEDFASSGFVHCDITWRHFGSIGKEIYLCDLGEIKKSNKNGIKSWLKKSISFLEERSAETTQSAPSSIASDEGSGRKRGKKRGRSKSNE